MKILKIRLRLKVFIKTITLKTYFSSHQKFLKLLKKAKENHVIVIVARKDFFTIASIFACIFLGKPYSVVDFSMPRERLKKILEKCEARLVLSSKKENLSFLKLEIININKNYLLNRKHASKYIIEKIPDSKACYIMFTSGSTGFPKGAIISRDSLLRFSKLCKYNFSLKNSDNLTNLNPIYFDNSIFDIFASLLNGLTLTIFFFTEQDLKKPVSILRKINILKPTVWFSTPSLLIY